MQTSEYPRRIGWEFWERPPLNPFPAENHAPQLVYPPPPNTGMIMTSNQGKRQAGIWVIIVAAVIGLAALGAKPIVAIVLLCGAAGMGYGGYLLITAGSRESHSEVDTHRAARARAEAQYQAALADWTSQRNRWYQEETARVQAIPMFYTVNLLEPRNRLDVFGGQLVGWASLLNTVARPLIEQGIGVTVLDFTESSVAIELGLHAAKHGKRVQQCLLPADLEQVDLLKGFGAAEAAEVLVSASHSVRDRSGREDEEHREVDTAIIAEVCSELEAGGLTVRRILHGLDVVNQATKRGTEKVVSAAERTALEENPYLSATTDRVRDRYSYLRPRLERLAPMAAKQSTDVTRLPKDGDVSILAVEGSTHRETSLLSNLTAQCVLQRARGKRGTGPANRPLVVVIGADVLNFETVSTLSRRAIQAGVRTAFMFQNLDSDAQRLLGTDGSETIFLQLQHHEQAQRAAEFIGKRHRFVLGQLTKSVGDALGRSEGGNRSWTNTTSETSGEGASYGWSVPNSKNWSFSRTNSYAEMYGTQWSDTWQKTNTYGETATRVYEYDTEPRSLQELGVSAFVYASHAGGRTKIVAGDCNPGLAEVSYAAQYPREVCPLR